MSATLRSRRPRGPLIRPTKVGETSSSAHWSRNCVVFSLRPGGWCRSATRGRSGVDLANGAILDLPGVVERVPRYAAGGVARGPATFHHGVGGTDGGLQRLKRRISKRCYGGRIRVRGHAEAQSELARIGALSHEDVLDHLVAIASAARSEEHTSEL